MSYTVILNGKSSEVNSYAAATSTIKSAVEDHAKSLSNPHPQKLYRSPQTAAKVNAARAASAKKLTANVKFPKTAGNVTGSVAGLNYAIARK